MEMNTFETTEQLENRLKEIENLVNLLLEEKQNIQKKLIGDEMSKKLCVSKDSIVNNRKEENEKEKEVEMKIKEDSDKKRLDAINHKQKLREEKY